MNSILEKNLFFVKEHVGMFKAANNYDIYDPETQNVIMNCREENLGFFTKILRFTSYKVMTPFNIVVKIPNGKNILRVERGTTFWRSKVKVYDEHNQYVGFFKQQLFSFGGKFTIYDPTEKPVCTLKGKWTSWEFSFLRGEEKIANVSKKWAGLGKELFTTADNYMLEIFPTVKPEDRVRELILAAVLCIDMVLKER
ncbi:RNAse [Neptunitalea chrysea]|uniref:RNAse n=1 Tax=Neptunitalea chrysea TaxID=1647581 RepID=A0A9W6B5U7_9FLAO|nr:phospholipid scramblase-related protein [Neptunitalea chrysea]GLB53193.1 RNAse [Neptunitalea chrysea]